MKLDNFKSFEGYFKINLMLQIKTRNEFLAEYDDIEVANFRYENYK